MHIQPLGAERREAIKHDCEIVVRLAREVFRREIRYDDESIKWLAWLIEFSRKKPEEQQVKQNILTSIACFLGEAIIAQYGGEWVMTESGDLGVCLPSQTLAFPFLKVSKHFKNGESDSIWGMFKMGEAPQKQDSQPDAPPNGGPPNRF